MYRYILTIQNTAYDVSSLINSDNTTIKKPLNTKEYKSATGTANFTLTPTADITLYSSVLQAILQARANLNKTDCVVEIFDEFNICIFRGYLDESTLNENSAKHAESLALSARDKTILLDEKIKENKFFEGYTRANWVAVLVAYSGADVSGVDTSIMSDQKVVSNYCITDDGKLTYRQVIDSILLHYPGKVLQYEPSNDKFIVKNTKFAFNEQATYRQVRYKISQKLSTSAGIYDYDGVLVTYPTISERENQNVYTENINVRIGDADSYDSTKSYVVGDYVTYDNKLYQAKYNIEPEQFVSYHWEEKDLNTLVGLQIRPNDYFPTDGDIKAITQQFSAEGLDRAYITKQSRLKNDEIALMYVKNCSYSQMADYDLSPSPDLPNIDYDGIKYYPTKAWILLKNTHSRTVNLQDFSIKGTAVYKSALNKITAPYDSQNRQALCTKPEEIETDTIYNEADAKEFANWIYNVHKYSNTTSTWVEPQLVSQLGEIVYVVHPQTGIAIPHAVIQIDDIAKAHNERQYKITAICIDGYKRWLDTDYKTDATKAGGESKNQRQYYYHTVYVNNITTGEGYSVTPTDQLYMGTYSDTEIADATTFAIATQKGVKWNYTKGAQGQSGQDGTSVTITSKSIQYQNSTSGTVVPTGTWTNSPSPETGKYTWTRTIVNYSDGTNTTSYAVSYVGINGQDGQKGADGTSVTITSKEVVYVNSTSSTTIPTSGWGSSITPQTGKYFWTRTTVNYSDGNSTVSYSVSYIGINGSKGDKGDTGATGPQGPTGANGQSVIWKGNLSSAPANPQKLWAYYNTTQKKSYIFNGSSWEIMTVDGATGPQGPAGPTGPQGQDAGHYLGTVKSASEISTLNPNKGDGILITAQFSGYTYGSPYIYSGAQWIEQKSITADNSSMLLAMLNDARGIEVGVIKWFSDLVCDRAVINQLFTNEITMTESGIIKSNDYAEDSQGMPTKGYKLIGNEGVVKAKGIKAVDLVASGNSVLQGSVEHPFLKTQKAVPSTSAINYTETTAYYNIKTLISDFRTKAEQYGSSNVYLGQFYNQTGGPRAKYYGYVFNGTVVYRGNTYNGIVIPIKTETGDINSGIFLNSAPTRWDIMLAYADHYETSYPNHLYISKSYDGYYDYTLSSINCSATFGGTTYTQWSYQQYYRATQSLINAFASLPLGASIQVASGTAKIGGSTFTVPYSITKGENILTFSNSDNALTIEKDSEYYTQLVFSSIVVQSGIDGIVTGSIEPDTTGRTIGYTKPFDIIKGNQVWGAVFN